MKVAIISGEEKKKRERVRVRDGERDWKYIMLRNKIKQNRTCSLFRFINCNVFQHRRLGPSLLIDTVHDQVEHRR